jgi:membrane-bound serine protease (ClpP class)
VRRLAILLLAASALLGVAASSAAAAPVDTEPGDTGAVVVDAVVVDAVVADPAQAPVDVLQVSGLFDEIVVASIRDAIDRAAEEGSQALILQVNSDGAVVGNATMTRLLEDIAAAPVAIGVWIGPSGARLYGTPAQILAVADVTGMAPGSRVGYTGPALRPGGEPIDFGAATTTLRNQSLGLSQARELEVFKQRITDEGIPTIVNMVDALDGFEKNGLILETTTEVVTDDGTVQRDTVATVRFFKLGLIDQLFHTVASPPIAYLLLLIGLALIVFEFFTAGVGIAGAVGAGSLILASYGLAALPTRPWAVALIVLAMVAFAIDVQVGLPRVWTGVGVVFTIIGSWFLFEPIVGSSLRPSWIALIAGIAGIMLTFIVGMPSMVRTRFATPTIGREWMIGETGSVIDRVGPEGIVEVRDARWRARTNRATPVEAGEPVRVVAIDGVTLEVEPLEGAAKDYREMRSGT